MTIETPLSAHADIVDFSAVVEAALARAKAARAAGKTLDPPLSAIEVEAMLASLVGIGQLTAAEARALKDALTEPGGVGDWLRTDEASPSPLYGALRQRAQANATDFSIDSAIPIGQAIVQALELAEQIVDGLHSLWDAIFG